MTEYQRIFRSFDLDGNGSIDRNELTHVMKALGYREVNNETINALIREVDLDNNSTIEFNEFLEMFVKLKSGAMSKDSGIAKVVSKAGQELNQVTAASGGVHSFADEEKVAFAEHINKCLRSDAHISYMMPIDTNSMDLFKAVSNGVLLCKLINLAVPNTIDERALNLKQNLNIFQTQENVNLALGAAKAIGCTVVNVHTENIIEGSPHLVLGLIWQIVKIQLLSAINLKQHPELIRLLEEGEELGDLLKLPAEQLLLRWFNYHLKMASHPRRVANFSGDVKDSECYTVLLNRVAPQMCDLSPLQITDTTARATKVLQFANNLGCEAFIKPSDIVKGNSRLNLAFVASIFNTCPGLDPPTQEELYAAAELLDDDAEGTREERAFRMWINCLGIEDVYINNLYEDLKDGIILLKVMDHVQPGIVQWRQVTFKPNNKFKKVGNANYAVVLGKQMKFSLVGIGGVDIVNGTKKLVLGLVWQLMRLHTLQIIGNLTEAELLEWANGAVASKGKNMRISSLRDHSISDGRFLLELFASIEPRAINWEIVTDGANKEEKAMNAKYVISVARKLGATIFLLWEDIVEVNPKMILTLIAAAARLARKSSTA
eukprot:GILK01000487.1.p1 GENE.GILK01000487.1~~GILK01000487.1.p1  ORF type:complete len:651 (-),score=158.79 GILK01000487.1:343-2151(-)